MSAPTTSFRTTASSVTDPITISKRGWDWTAWRFSVRPVERSSRTTTSWPAVSRASVRCDPMNPAPPVTSVRTRVQRSDSDTLRPIRPDLVRDRAVDRRDPGPAERSTRPGEGGPDGSPRVVHRRVIIDAATTGVKRSGSLEAHARARHTHAPRDTGRLELADAGAADLAGGDHDLFDMLPLLGEHVLQVLEVAEDRDAVNPRAHLRPVVVDESHHLALEGGIVPELAECELAAVPGSVDEHAAGARAGPAEHLTQQPERRAAGPDHEHQQEPVEHEDGA